jgi:hypothetical protein
VTKPYPLEVLSDPEKTFEDTVQASQADIVESDEGVVERSLVLSIASLKKPGLAYMQANTRAKELWKEL